MKHSSSIPTTLQFFATPVDTPPLSSTNPEYQYSVINGQATITSYTGTSVDLVIPDTIDGYPVTGIGGRSFSSNPNNALKTLNTNKVTLIDSIAFQSITTLESIIMPEVTKINTAVFESCTSLTNAIMPKVTSIDANAFSHCTNLDHANLPNATTVLVAAFFNSGIKYVAMPKAQSIAGGAFSSCPQLKSISLSKDVGQTGANAFASSPIENVTMDYGTSDIFSVPMNDWNTFVSKLIGLDLSKVTGKYAKNTDYIKDLVTGFTYAVNPSGATIINYSGTATDLIIPQTFQSIPVIAIGDGAFRLNSTLSTLTILQDLTIGNNVFEYCSSLKTVTMPYITSMGTHNFYGCVLLEKVSAPMLTTIASTTFARCTALASTDFSSATFVGMHAFSNCSSLQNIDLPAALTLDYNAFEGCNTLTTITLPNVETVRNSAFNGCNALPSIFLPNITSLGNVVFSTCYALRKVTFSSGLIDIGLSVFTSTPLLSNITIYYGTADISYLTINDWDHFVGRFEGLDAATITEKFVQNATRIRQLPDTISPVIENVPTKIDLEINSTYTLPTPTATDDSGALIVVHSTNNIDITTLGNYTVTYAAQDPSGNMTTVTAPANVIDTTSPTITLNGANPMTLEVGLSTYAEPGVTIVDNSGEFITPTISGTVNTNQIGQYTLTYTAIDLSNNSSSITRTINVIDTTSPVIILTGSSPMTLEVGLSTYTEPGATTIDNSGEAIIPIILGSVNTDKIGQYSLTYIATDSSHNTSSVSRIVNIIDTTSPTITLDGANPMVVEANTSFIDPGVTIVDNSNELISPVVSSTININKLGQYTVTYTATDSSHNTASVARTVSVIDNISPVITLKGSNTMTLIVGSSFSDPGAIVADNYDTGLKAIVSGTVNPNKVGVYTLTYNATDSSGNKAIPVIRTIYIIYNFTGLKLININNSNVFNWGAPIVMYFQLKNAKGTPISTATAKLFYAPVIHGVVGQYKDAIPFPYTTTGNLFSYNSCLGQYYFTMNTLFLDKGTYQLKVSLDDGQSYATIQIVLK